MSATILIVDDEKKIREIYKKLLLSEGFQVKEAEGSEEAANALIEDKTIGLMLLDIQMPIVNGAALYEMIRSYNSAIKIIVTSVYPLEEQRMLVSRADDYFDKSQGMGVLLAKIYKQLPLDSAESTPHQRGTSA